MSEQRPILGRTAQSISENSPQNPSQAAEAQLRQALEHMGGRRLSLGSNAHGKAAATRANASGSAQRHRYVREGEVPVVHATLGRQGARPDAALQQDKTLIDSLRLDLERERAARESAERSVNEARAALTALQTRLVHLEMDLQAAQEQAARAAPEPVEQAAPARRKPRAERVAEDAEDEPQPVKWWLKGE